MDPKNMEAAQENTMFLNDDEMNVTLNRDLTGQTIGNVKIIRPLGEGGMGRVFLGKDVILDRLIAVKSLKTDQFCTKEHRLRFLREAKILARLNHPNICQLYDFRRHNLEDVLFLEYIEGSSLCESMTSNTSYETKLSYAIEIASALEAAHSESIIHRDLKPDNVMIRHDNTVKVLDFGIARWTSDQLSPPGKRTADHRVPQSMDVTTEGNLFGTLRYMSPEQAKSEELTTASDMFTFGIILQELFMNTKAYQCRHVQEQLFKVTQGDALPVTGLNRPLTRLINRLKSMNPSDRPTASETVKILTSIQKSSKLRIAWIAAIASILIILPLWLMRTPYRQSSTILVIPFDDRGPFGHGEFARGLSLEISSRLAGYSGLSLLYAEPNRTIQNPINYGKERSAQYVLYGSVRWQSKNILIEPHLVHIGQSKQLWSKSYQKNSMELVRLEASIAEDIAKALGYKITDTTALPQGRHRTNSEAYQAYIRGRSYDYILTHSRDQYEIPLKLFQRALELDPDFAAAHAYASRIYSAMYLQGLQRTRDVAEKAKQHALSAMDLEPESPDGLTAWGIYLYRVKRDDNQALKSFHKAKQHWPGNLEIDEAIALVHRRQGHFKKARAEMQAVYDYDNRNPRVVLELAHTCFFLQDFEQARVYYRQSIALVPDKTTAWLFSAWNEWRDKGNLGRAQYFLNQLPDPNQPIAHYFSFLQYLYQNQPERALRTARELPTDSVVWQLWFIPRPLLEARALNMLEQHDEALIKFIEAEAVLSKLIAKNNEDSRIHAAMAQALTGQGRFKEAIKHAERAVSLAKKTSDYLLLDYQEINLAYVLKMAGRKDEWLNMKRKFVNRTSWLTPSMLKIDPRWREN
jgi:serine/threonine protein kinase